MFKNKYDYFCLWSLMAVMRFVQLRGCVWLQIIKKYTTGSSHFADNNIVLCSYFIYLLLPLNGNNQFEWLLLVDLSVLKRPISY